MLFDLVDTLQKRRRLVYIVMFVVADFWLLSFCSQTLQTHRSSITARIHDSESSQNSPSYVSDSLDGTAIVAGIHRVAMVSEAAVLRAAVATTDGMTKVEHGLRVAGIATVHVADTTMMVVVHTFTGTAAFAWQMEILPYEAVSHGVSLVSRVTDARFASVIRPQDNNEVPIITAQQAQQASLIQSGTLAFVASTSSGLGGACDDGAGNGGYPMEWCDAPLDTIRTVSYSADRINRECTSYAYWYFTAVEGHNDFHVTGNANRWAYTSSYPVHRAPVAGAIAVETAGAFGHVAIVQALPGQAYDGKVVPPGYVLVSEMNYDWQGHFRYSYSPLAKFSAYIY